MENIPEQEGRTWIDYLLTRITDLITLEEYERALPIAEEGLLILPDNTCLLYLMSTIFQNLHPLEKSLQLLEKILTIDPFDLTARSALGRNLMFQGYYHGALEVMSQFGVMSNRLDGLNKLYIHYCRACSGNAKPVIEFCDWRIEEFQNEPEAAVYVAVNRALKVIAQIQNHEDAAAIRLAFEIDEEFDSNLFVAYAKGIACWKKGDLNSAESFLRLASTNYPWDMRVKKDLADLLSERGYHDEAVDIRREITGIFGPFNRNEDPVYRAEELITLGKLEEAERFLAWAREQYPDRNDLILPLISFCYFTGQYDSVISYADSLETSPYAWKAVYLKASAYYAAGDVRAAIRCLISAIARDRMISLHKICAMKMEGFFRDPENPGPEGMAFQVFCTDGIDPAIPLFEMLVDTNPDMLEYRAFLTYCYILSDRYVDAALCAEPLSVSDEPDMCMIRVLAMRVIGCLEDAKQVTEETRKEHPEYVPALNMYVRILTDLGMYRSAYFELLSHWDTVTTDAALTEVFIRCLIRAGEFHVAATAAIRLIQTNPDRPLDYTLLALACMHDGNNDAAFYAIRESFRFEGFTPESLRMYVKLLIQAAEPKEALIIFSECDEYFPESPEIRYLKAAAGILSGEDSSGESVEECAVRIFQTENGILRGYIGEYRIAARLLAEEIRQNPSDNSLRVAYARVLFEFRQYSEGLHQVSLAIENGGDDSRTLEFMDAILTALRMNSSIEDFMRISRGDMVRMAGLVHQQAVRQKQSGVRRQAIEACRYLAGLPSSSPAVQYIRADACQMLGDLEEDPDWYEQGLGIFDGLLSEDPDNAGYLAEKGLLLVNLSRYQEAEDVLVRALELDPDSGVASSALCWCLTNTGRPREAISYGDQATCLIPDDWGAWNNRGLAKYALQDFEGAAEDFRQAIRCHPGEVIPRRNLCEVLLRLEDDEVHGAYGDLLVRFGNTAFPHEEEEQSQRTPVSRRHSGTVTGYMDGYW